MKVQGVDSIEHVRERSKEGTRAPAAQAARLLDEAVILRREDRFGDALHKTDSAVVLAPSMAEAHNMRGIVLEGLGRMQEAKQAYRQAVDLDPYLLDAHNNLHVLEAQLRAGPEAPPAEGRPFWIRAGAYIIDAVAFWILYLLTTTLVAFVAGLLLAMAGQELRLYSESGWLDSLVPGVLSVIYFAIFEWLYGASLGKLLLRMRVTMANGERCTLRAALIRSAVRYVDGFFFAIPAYATMKAPLYQRIGDKAANTIVVGAGDPDIRTSRAGWWFVVALVIYFAANAVGSLLVIGASSIGPQPFTG